MIILTEGQKKAFSELRSKHTQLRSFSDVIDFLLEGYRILTNFYEY